MSILGQTFKQKREELGLSIAEVSQKLDIQERYIQAIEDEKLESIPGDYYTKNFVTQYANLLNLDGEKLLAQYASEKSAVVADKASEATKPLKSAVSNTVGAVSEGVKKPLQSGLATAGAVGAGLAGAGSQVAQVVTEKKSKKGLLALLAALLFLALGGIYLATRYANFGQNNNGSTGSSTAGVTTSSATSSSSEESTTASESSESSSEESTTAQDTTVAESSESASADVNATAGANVSGQTDASTAGTSNAAVQTTAPVQTTQTIGNGIGAGNGVAGAVADVFAQNSGVGQVTYGLGQSYAGYTGNYNFNLTVTEPTWVRATVHGATVYEGMVNPGAPLNFWAVNNASNAQVLLGISSGATLTMNGQVIPVPTSSRVQAVQMNLAK